jgi:hypothetical protein
MESWVFRIVENVVVEWSLKYEVTSVGALIFALDQCCAPRLEEIRPKNLIGPTHRQSQLGNVSIVWIP